MLKQRTKKPGVGTKCARIFVVEGGCVRSLFDEVPPPLSHVHIIPEGRGVGIASSKLSRLRD